MFVFGHDIPLVEIILTMGVITAIILLEAIIILVLMIYRKRRMNSKSAFLKGNRWMMFLMKHLH